MKKLKKRLNDLRGIIIGLRMEMSLLETDLSRIEVDLFYLDKMQRDLIYNLNLLKSNEVISVISEYKKSLEALREVRKKIISIKHTRQYLQASIKDKNKQCDYYYNQLDKKVNEQSRVLQFKKKA